MKTKFKVSSKSQKKSILKNRNFLNSQNYILSEGKGYLLYLKGLDFIISKFRIYLIVFLYFLIPFIFLLLILPKFYLIFFITELDDIIISNKIISIIIFFIIFFILYIIFQIVLYSVLNKRKKINIIFRELKKKEQDEIEMDENEQSDKFILGVYTIYGSIFNFILGILLLPLKLFIFIFRKLRIKFGLFPSKKVLIKKIDFNFNDLGLRYGILYNDTIEISLKDKIKFIKKLLNYLKFLRNKGKQN